MAKARSKRTMRNRKSRNRRGGMFGCLNCSPEKKAFKEARDTNEASVCQHISSIIKGDNGINNIQMLFNQLSDTVKTGDIWYSSKNDKEILTHCIAKMDIYDSIFKGLPNNSDLKGKLKIQKETLDEQLRQQELREIRLREQEEQQQQQRQERVVQDHDNHNGPKKKIENIGFRYPRPISNTALNPNSQNAGKSRRRHRRGRTLHKRRKSRKVRKTRCRRK